MLYCHITSPNRFRRLSFGTLAEPSHQLSYFKNPALNFN